MDEWTVVEVRTTEEWSRAIPLLRQLWTDADESFVESWAEEDGYRLLCLVVDDAYVAVVGLSIQRVLHHARHVWVHDFVVDEAHRSSGYGATLLSAVEDWARERDCTSVALACRLGNEAAHGFYEHLGFEDWATVMEKSP